MKVILDDEMLCVFAVRLYVFEPRFTGSSTDVGGEPATLKVDIMTL